MYDFLRGRIIAIDTTGHCSIEVQGVGYLLRVSEHSRHDLPLDGSDVLIYTRLVVRDDDWQLFGFSDPGERVAFDLLTSVQGVGPAAAMAVLSTMTIDQFRQALAQRDAKAFQQVKGIGTKTAQRLALELHDKLDRIPVHLRPDAPAASSARAWDEARMALIALGFAAKNIDALAEDFSGSKENSETLVRLALARLR